MLERLKTGLLHGLQRSGVAAIVARSGWRQRRLLILCYHGTSLLDEHLWDPTLFVTRDHLARRFQVLRDAGCTVLRFGEAVERLYANDLPPRAVTITFDDGHYDFFAKAYPVVEEFGYPVTVYLTTYYCFDQRPVFDMATSYILWRGRDRGADPGAIADGLEVGDLSTAPAREAALGEIMAFALERDYSAAEKHELARSLAERLHVDFDEILERRILHLMNPSEVTQVANGLVDVQLHTHRHFTPLVRASFDREVNENRDAIRELTDSTATHLCYPSGECDERIFPWLEENQVVSGVTCTPGLAHADQHRFLLPRILDKSNMREVEFRTWVSGVSDWLPRRAD